MNDERDRPPPDPDRPDQPVAPAPTGPVPGQRTTRVGVWVVFAAQVALVVVLLPAGLLAPPAGVAVLAVWWVLITAAAWRSRQRRPLLAYGAPLLTLAGWWLILTVGDLMLGWTA